MGEGGGGWKEEARAEKSHLGILFDRYKHSLLEFDVLCCEKVQVRLFLLFSLALLESINFWTGRGDVSGTSVHAIPGQTLKETNPAIPEIESGYGQPLLMRFREQALQFHFGEAFELNPS